MDRDAHYIAVGAFVLTAIVATIVFVNWYAQRGDAREQQHYAIYFTGSVSGLNEGGPVRYLGVNVGRVQRITLAPGEPLRVRVLIDVDAATPVTRNTEASLRLQGVTGLLYIELTERSGAPQVPDVPPDERYPVIATSPSELDQLVASLPELVERATLLLDRGVQLLSESNIEAVSAGLASLREASGGLPQTVADVRRVIGRLEAAMEDIAEGARRIGAMTERMEPDALATLDRLRSAADNLASMSQRLDAVVARNELHIDQFAESGLVDLQRMIEQARATAAELEALAASLRRDPSQLVSRPSYRGVEIER